MHELYQLSAWLRLLTIFCSNEVCWHLIFYFLVFASYSVRTFRANLPLPNKSVLVKQVLFNEFQLNVNSHGSQLKIMNS